MSTVKSIRFDHIEQPFGGLAAAWGFRSGRDDSIIREYLATAYTIPEDGVRLRPEMTHEFNLYMLHPKVGIDFETSLFNQPKLVPLRPSVVGFQMQVGNEKWVELYCHNIIEGIRHFGDEIDVSLVRHIVSKTPVAMTMLRDPEELLVAAI